MASSYILLRMILSMLPDRYPWGLSPDLLHEVHQKNNTYVLFKLSLLFLIWSLFGIAILATDSILIKVVLWFILGYFINGIVQLIHDSWHNNLFTHRWANRFFGHCISFLFFTLYEPPRHGHMMHHRFNRTDKDPDAYNAGAYSLSLFILFYGVFFLGAPLAIIHFNVLYPLQFYKRNQLLAHFLQLAVFMSVHGLLWVIIIKAQLFHLAWQVWLMPILFVSPWNGVKSVADHFQNEWEGKPLRTATTIHSNRMTTYLWNGLNYHLEHHLFPRVPGYHLAKLHPHLKELFQQNNSPLFKSYTQVWFHAVLRGPERVQREGNFNPFNFQIEKET